MQRIASLLAFFPPVLLLIPMCAALSAQTLTITIRTQPPSPQAYIEDGALVAGCDINGERREMVLPRDERVLSLSIGDQPATSAVNFSCIVSKRDSGGTALPLGEYRVQCADSGSMCLPWHRCDGAGCTAE